MEGSPKPWVPRKRKQTIAGFLKWLNSVFVNFPFLSGVKFTFPHAYVSYYAYVPQAHSWVYSTILKTRNANVPLR